MVDANPGCDALLATALIAAAVVSPFTSPAPATVGLRKSFGAHIMLNDIDLEVPAGTVLSLLGPSGAGKTTTVGAPTLAGHEKAGLDPLDLHVQVRDCDVVVAYGYHGPSGAAPGYPMYYLDVRAGPAQEWSGAVDDFL